MSGKISRGDSTYLRQLKKAYAEWDAGRLSDAAYDEIAHRLMDEVNRRDEAGRISSAAFDKFLDEYSANVYAVHDM